MSENGNIESAIDEREFFPGAWGFCKSGFAKLASGVSLLSCPLEDQQIAIAMDPDMAVLQSRLTEKALRQIAQGAGELYHGVWEALTTLRLRHHRIP